MLWEKKRGRRHVYELNFRSKKDVSKVITAG